MLKRLLRKFRYWRKSRRRNSLPVLRAWWVRYFLHCIAPLYPDMTFEEETRCLEHIACLRKDIEDYNALVRQLVPRYDNMRHRRKVAIRRLIRNVQEHKEKNVDVTFTISAEERNWYLRVLKFGFLNPGDDYHWEVEEVDQCEACLEQHGPGHCHVEIVWNRAWR